MDAMTSKQSIRILVGTQTGTAEMVAEEITDVLEAQGLEVETYEMDDLGVDVFSCGFLYILCSSTFGQGDVPDGAQGFYDALRTQSPDLSAISYGLFGLGDMTYADTFCGGPKRFKAEMDRLGAKLIGEPMWHDASSGELPEDDAPGWAETWIVALKEHFEKEQA